MEAGDEDAADADLAHARLIWYCSGRGRAIVAAAILAGGRASRLGRRDKASLPLGGARLIERQLAALDGVVDRIVVIVSEARAADRYADLGVSVVADAVPGAGALGGVYTAVTATPAARTLVIACDLPFLRTAFLRHLREAVEGADAAVPRTPDGWQPLCACYARSAAAPLRGRIDRGALKLVDALADLRVREIGPEEIGPYDPDGLLFFNVNTPHDYARALDKLATDQHG